MKYIFGALPHAAVPESKLKFAEKMSQSIAGMPMGTSFVTSSYPTTKHVMSQSTAPGFSLNSKGETNGDAMAQSQIIDAMLETSELAKTSLVYSPWTPVGTFRNRLKNSETF
ncbi:unnamed protein product, partial [Mesorhabditis belari]|uniref:Uncharacterized protein n=1 Tax=Mesorhabditis belari TaxID=2138241 RepID=A0AAF3EHK3_9BILA